MIEKYCGDILQLLEKLQAGECTMKGFIEFKLFQCRQLILDTGKYSMSEVRFTFYFFLKKVIDASQQFGFFLFV